MYIYRYVYIYVYFVHAITHFFVVFTVTILFLSRVITPQTSIQFRNSHTHTHFEERLKPENI